MKAASLKLARRFCCPDLVPPAPSALRPHCISRAIANTPCTRTIGNYARARCFSSTRTDRAWRAGGFSWSTKTKTATLISGSALGLAGGGAFASRTSHADNEGSNAKNSTGRGAHDDGETSQETMLDTSAEEKKEKKEAAVKGASNIVVRVLLKLRRWVCVYVLEPCATSRRFVHLLVIFIPVILAMPATLFGTRIEDRDYERTGTLWWYDYLVRSLESAGATFIKLGQWAASRSDIFPPELCARLSSLHSNVPPHPFEETKEIICRAFDGMAFEDVFEEFDETPLGVGAIAQVHRAKLRPGVATPKAEKDEERYLKKLQMNIGALLKAAAPMGSPSSSVSVKVLHPGVENFVGQDLRILHFLASMINMIPTMEWLSLPDEVEQFGQMMKLQLDLRIEGMNLAIFRQNFRDRSTAWFPYPYTSHTTRSVLIEEFAQGLPLNTFLVNGGGDFDKEIAQEGLDAFLHMLLIDNFTHSDLHPGNIMVRFYKPRELELFARSHEAQESDLKRLKDETDAILSRLRPIQHDREKWVDTLNQISSEGYRPQIIFIDTGLVTELNDVNRRNFLDLFHAIAEFDGYRTGELMVDRCRRPEVVTDREVFALKMQHLVLAVKSRTFALGHVKIGDVLSQVLSMVRTYHVRLEGDFVNVVISCLLLEGIGRKLDPELDLFKSALPILRRLGPGATVLKSVQERNMSMLRVWLSLEARSFVKDIIGAVEDCVKYDRLAPNV